MKHHKISVSEALKKLEAGESVSDYLIDFDRIKIESLDVMKLSKGGIVVPEEVIYYNNNVQLELLIEKLLDGFYQAQKIASEKHNAL